MSTGRPGSLLSGTRSLAMKRRSAAVIRTAGIDKFTGSFSELRPRRLDIMRSQLNLRLWMASNGPKYNKIFYRMPLVDKPFMLVAIKVI